jgi:enamine deaminase RidA (YjgF/YER057c/UK114 family)
VYILEKIEWALEQTGASLADVVRTRIYVADINQWEPVARAHREFFGEIRPANTLVQIGALVAGRLVEIEADAYMEN